MAEAEGGNKDLMTTWEAAIPMEQAGFPGESTPFCRRPGICQT